MIEKLDHIGIAVKDLDQAMKLYREAFGIEPSLVYESAYTKAKIAFFNVGESRIELIMIGTDNCDMLIHTGRQDTTIHLASTRDGVARDVEKHVTFKYLNVGQFGGVLLANVRKAIVMETVVVDVLASDQGVRPAREINIAATAWSRAASDLGAHFAKTYRPPLTRHFPAP